MKMRAHLDSKEAMFTTQYLRGLVQKHGAGRMLTYAPALASTPYTFNTFLIVSKVKELLGILEDNKEVYIYIYIYMHIYIYIYMFTFIFIYA